MNRAHKRTPTGPEEDNLKLEAGPKIQDTLVEDCRAHGALPVNNIGLTRTMAAIMIKRTFDIDGRMLESLFTGVVFLEEGTGIVM